MNVAKQCTELNTDSVKIKVVIGSRVFFANLYNNATVNEFKTLLPLTITMSELNGNEKYADLPKNLTKSESKPGQINTGDLMLYGSNTVVLFYKTFSSSYSYSKLARVAGTTELASALGRGGATVTFQLATRD